MYFSAHQEEYAQSLYPLAGAGVVVADVQRVQKELMKRKRYIDITGNLLNHPMIILPEYRDRYWIRY